MSYPARGAVQDFLPTLSPDQLRALLDVVVQLQRGATDGSLGEQLTHVSRALQDVRTDIELRIHVELHRSLRWWRTMAFVLSVIVWVQIGLWLLTRVPR